MKRVNGKRYGRKPKKKIVRRVPGCVKFEDEEAAGFLRHYNLWDAMQSKAGRAHEQDSDEELGDHSVMVSVGAPVMYLGQPYICHIYHIKGYEEHDGWIVHLWHAKLVGHKRPSYRSYMTQMSEDLQVDLWSTGI